MDKVLEKFGIYDFLGIWGPGAITITYYMFTLHDPILRILNFLGIDQLNLSQIQIIIILYTAVSYMVGVILHELGKIISNFFKPFHTKNTKKCAHVSMSKPPRIRPFKSIKYEYHETITQNIDLDVFDGIGFEEATSYLKYNPKINTKRVDNFHSLYGLSRSLTLCFIFHAFFAVILCFYAETKYLYIACIDAILIWLFYVRTYRYFHYWVKNVFIQYAITNKQTIYQRR